MQTGLRKVLLPFNPLLLFAVQTYQLMLDALMELIISVLLITKVKCQLHCGLRIGLESIKYVVEI
jgi:hypothetical protein